MTGDDFFHGSEYKGDVFFIGGTRTVDEDWFVGRSNAEELFFDIFDSEGVFHPAFILGKADVEVDFLDFFFEEILLVEEEDDRGVGEPGAVDQVAEEAQRLVHALDVGVLSQAHVVLGQRHEEHQGSHLREAVQPLAPLRALAAHVDDVEDDAVRLELELDEPGRARSQVDAVLRAGPVAGGREAVDVEEGVLGGVGQLQLRAALVRLADGLGLPERGDGVGHSLVEDQLLEVAEDQLVCGLLQLGGDGVAPPLAALQQVAAVGEHVVEDDGEVGQLLVVGDAGAIDAAELLQYCTLSRLSSAEEQQLESSVLVLLCFSEVLIDLLIRLNHLWISRSARRLTRPHD